MKIINRLKSLFFTHKEKKAMTDTVVEVPEATPSAEFKTGVEDFEKAFEFVTAGVKTLGDAAKDELKALAKKYL